jgi:hypothetical protein
MAATPTFSLLVGFLRPAIENEKLPEVYLGRLKQFQKLLYTTSPLDAISEEPNLSVERR